MKKLLSLAATLAVLVLSASAADSFVQQLTAEERAAAGLDQLTATQRAALDRLAERYAKEGSRAAVAQVREEVKAEVRAEAKAEVEQEAKARKTAKFGLTRGDDDAETIKAKIRGSFKGWDGRTLFPLENGQTWVQTDKSDVYWLPQQEGPEVEIKQSGLGGWKLFLPDSGRWVRVRRVN